MEAPGGAGRRRAGVMEPRAQSLDEALALGVAHLDWAGNAYADFLAKDAAGALGPTRGEQVCRELVLDALWGSQDVIA